MAAHSKATEPMIRVLCSIPGTWQYNTTLPFKSFALLVLLLIFITLWPSCWLPLVDSTSVSKLQSETHPPLTLQLKNFNLLVPEASLPKVKSSRLSSPPRFKFSIRSASYNNTHDFVKEMQQATIIKPTTTLARIAKLQAPTPAKPKDRPPASTKTPVPEPSSSEAPTPELRGDFALFGRPSIVGGFNLTAGILVNTTFTVLLLASAGLGTWQRANSRRLLREEMDQAGFIEAGYSSNVSAYKRGRDSSGGYERRGATESGAKMGDIKHCAFNGRGSSRKENKTSHATSTTQSFTGRQALTGHVGPKATITSSDPNRSRSNGARGTNGPYKERSPRQNRRAEAQAGPSVRFGNERRDFHNTRAGNSQQLELKMSPLGGMRYGNGTNRSDHLRQWNQDDYRKDSMDDSIHVNFNRPGYSLPRLPKPALRQQIMQPYQPLPRPLQSIVRTNSRRMPGFLPVATSSLSSTPTIGRELSRNANRKGSRSIAVDSPGSVDRSYSNATPRFATHDMNLVARVGGSAGIGSCSSPPLKNSHPTPIRRSSSKRLPPPMRG